MTRTQCRKSVPRAIGGNEKYRLLKVWDPENGRTLTRFFSNEVSIPSEIFHGLLDVHAVIDFYRPPWSVFHFPHRVKVADINSVPLPQRATARE